MKSLKIILILMLTAAVSSMFVACETKTSVSVKSIGSIEGNGEDDGQEGFEFKIGSSIFTSSEADFETIKNKLLGSMQESEKAHYDCEDAENFIIFTIWQDGNADVFVTANNGDDDAIGVWNENRKIYDNANTQLYQIAKDAGLKKSFRLCILNDENLDNALLIYQDGTCIYDPINDIDFMD